MRVHEHTEYYNALYVTLFFLLCCFIHGAFIEFDSSSTNETNPDKDKSIYNSRTESPSHSEDGYVVSERTRALLQSKVSDAHKEDLASMITIVTSKGQ